MNNTVNVRVNEADHSEKSGGSALYAWMCVILGYLFCLAFPPTQNPFGLFLVTVICNAVTAVAIAGKGARFGAAPVFSIIMSVVFSFSYLITSEPMPSFMAFLCSLAFYAYFIYAASGHRAKSEYDILPVELIKALFGIKGSYLSDIFVSMFGKSSKSGKTILKIVIGLFAAIIPTAVIISLLSYDGFFTELIDKFFAFLRNIDIGHHLRSLIFGVVVAMYLFGMYRTNLDPRKATDGERYRSAFRKLRVAPSLTVAFTVLPILIVYVVFFISQWQYYVSGFGGTLPEGVLNHAEYARNGFFELCAVSAINFVIIAVISLFMRREGKGNGAVYKTVVLVLSLMTLVLIGTAMAKMMLYIGQYGLTAKRVLASWVMITLALLFLVIILRLFTAKMKPLSVSAFVCAFMVLVLAMSNYNAVIAEYNVERYISGESETVDVKSLVKLGTAAVPSMTRLAVYMEEQGMTDDGGYLMLRSEIEKERIKLDEKRSIFELSVPSVQAKNAISDYYGENE